MKKNYSVFAPVGLCLFVALAPACLEEDAAPSALKSGGASASDATFTVTDMLEGTCENPRCFEVTSSKELSFIAVDAACSTASGITLDLYQYVNGQVTKVNASPSPHGAGEPCNGAAIPPDALKYEGLTDAKYLVCVTFEGVSDGGSVTVYAKAGTSCGSEEFDDCMCSSTDTTGAGGTGGTGGTGGAGATGGAGGAGGCDDCGCGGSGGWWDGSGGWGGWGGWCGDCGDCGGCGDCDP